MNISRKDIVGIGIGPSNLSLAALLHPISNISKVFLEQKSIFKWHEGMMLSNTQLQVHYLKDLVSLIDPTNPFSFISFLHQQKRLYQFINANFQRVSRSEFNQYYQWVIKQLPHLKFGKKVREVIFSHNKLAVRLDDEMIITDNLVLGCGLIPNIPSCAKGKLNSTLLHSNKFHHIHHDWRNKHVVIIGGGQTGAEITSYYLNQSQLPKKITWISRRDNFLPLDESPFVNELFTPSYSNYFFSLPENKRHELVKKQKLFSDGISITTLEKLYQKWYELEFIQGKKNMCCLMTSFEMTHIFRSDKNWRLSLKNTETREMISVTADIVVLCTGYHYEIPECINPLTHHILKDTHGHFLINSDYSLMWNKPHLCKIYIQNGALTTRGIADPNLSLSAWRSAIIINSIAGKAIYDTSAVHYLFNWNPLQSNLKQLSNRSSFDDALFENQVQAI